MFFLCLTLAFFVKLLVNNFDKILNLAGSDFDNYLLHSDFKSLISIHKLVY